MSQYESMRSKQSKNKSRLLSSRNLKPLKKKKKYTNTSRNPLLSVNTIFGTQNSSIKSLSSSLCIDALKQGCVDGFNEIFFLSHRDPVLIDPVTEEFFSVDSMKLVDVQKQLCEAENLLREKKHEEVFDIYIDLSTYLERKGDTDTALYYMKKGKGVCLASSNKRLWVQAFRKLGNLYSRLGDIDGAMNEHEQQLEAVEKEPSIFNEDDILNSKKDLIEVYFSKYEILKKEGSNGIRSCLPLLEKSYEICQGNKQLLGKICHLRGKSYHNLGMVKEALKYLVEFRNISDELGNVKSSSLADKHIAKILSNSKNYGDALEIYQQFLEKSRVSGDSRNIGKSCERIGFLLILKKQEKESLKYFEENYDLAKENGDMKWLNSARIRLGYARGVNDNETFLRKIKSNNISELLAWKDRRKWDE